jgi:hypothetical protein
MRNGSISEYKYSVTHVGQLFAIGRSHQHRNTRLGCGTNELQNVSLAPGVNSLRRFMQHKDPRLGFERAT